TLSSWTAVKWLHELSYNFHNIRKSVYKDGHERTDIVKYRQEQFLPTLKALEDLIYPPNVPEEIWPVILIVHDELTFNANDGRSKIWIKDDNAPLKKKSRKKGIMVSDFLAPGGQLQV
ncbi:hypothetical protein L873DRAFT_1647899, partial [Choiromyces venosus 120613-1]